ARDRSESPANLSHRGSGRDRCRTVRRLSLVPGPSGDGHCPRGMASIVAEVQACVVGAGVMGLSAAYQIASRGLSGMVLGRSVAGQEASAANAGTLGLQNKPIQSLPLVLRAVSLWRSMSEELGVDVQYERRGGFRLAHSAADVEKLEKAVIAQRAYGVAVEM